MKNTNFFSLQSDNLSSLVHCKVLGVVLLVQEKEERCKKSSVKISPASQINKLGLLIFFNSLTASDLSFKQLQ